MLSQGAEQEAARAEGNPGGAFPGLRGAAPAPPASGGTDGTTAPGMGGGGGGAEFLFDDGELSLIG